MSGHPLDDLAAYAIGALDTGERENVAAHLGSCASCAAEVARFDDVAWKLALASAAPPPPALRDRIVGRERTLRERLLGRFDWRVPLAIPIALSVALLATLGAYAQARDQNAAYDRAVSAFATGRVVTLDAVGGAKARGAVAVEADGSAQLVLSIAAPPAGKAWAAWVITGDRPVAAGLSGSSGGVVLMRLLRPVQAGDVIAVTLEDSGGADVPHGPPVLKAGI